MHYAYLSLAKKYHLTHPIIQETKGGYDLNFRQVGHSADSNPFSKLINKEQQTQKRQKETGKTFQTQTFNLILNSNLP